ncbi:hypothetical protein OOT00_10185 [Desulfobotulus sp. H1]|uniref:Uncharacterized protein n=1 Tax=Desulfobotulus pelophilus TaxID=2823377 RepID=A0ABT3NA74_9BACT|nr:hypothetical protein [Desulfobotulus pelophilus]MCW7754354.1 hypothetical protein [Desulfobotulus pelophilus]
MKKINRSALLAGIFFLLCLPAHSTQTDSLAAMEQEIADILEMLTSGMDDQKSCSDGHNIVDPALNGAITDMIAEEEEHALSRRERWENSREKGGRVITAVEKQILLKKAFIDNSRQAYLLASDVEKHLHEIRRELLAILASDAREMSGDEYIAFKNSIRQLSKDGKAADYTAGSILRETRRYIRHVANRDLKKAMNSFETMVSLQEKQLNLLEAMEYHTYEIVLLLKSI